MKKELNKKDYEKIKSELKAYYKNSFIESLGTDELCLLALNNCRWHGVNCMPYSFKIRKLIIKEIKESIFNTELSLYIGRLIKNSNNWYLKAGYYEYNLYFVNGSESQLIYSFDDPHEIWCDNIKNIKHYKKAKWLAELFFNEMADVFKENKDFEKLDLISKWKRNIINNIELKIIDYIRG